MILVFHKPFPVASEEELAFVPPEMLRKPDQPLKARLSAIAALKKMRASALSAQVSLLTISAYRTFEEQKELFLKAEERHGKGRGILWLAPAGYSEHHTGYVFDLADESRPETDDESSFETTAAFRWLSTNAKAFGFELSFPQNNWQGVGYEPWHMRYVGDDLSKKLFKPEGQEKWMQNARAIMNAIRLRFHP